MKRLILSICLIFAYNLNGKDYLDNLPDDSLIKERCHKCSKSWIPFYKNKVEKACDDLEKTLKEFDTKEPKSTSGLGWVIDDLIRAGNEEALRKLIRIILENETDEIKFQESDKVKDAALKIREKRAKRLEKEKQEAENLKNNPPRKF